MSIAKKVLNVAGVALAIYVGVFGLWLMLAMACLDHDANQCGGDSLTRMVRTTHAPLIALMFGSNNK